MPLPWPTTHWALFSHLARVCTVLALGSDARLWRLPPQPGLWVGQGAVASTRHLLRRELLRLSWHLPWGPP